MDDLVCHCPPQKPLTFPSCPWIKAQLFGIALELLCGLDSSNDSLSVVLKPAAAAAAAAEKMLEMQILGAHPVPSESHSGGGAQQSAINRPNRWFRCNLKACTSLHAISLSNLTLVLHYPTCLTFKPDCYPSLKKPHTAMLSCPSNLPPPEMPLHPSPVQRLPLGEDGPGPCFSFVRFTSLSREKLSSLYTCLPPVDCELLEGGGFLYPPQPWSVTYIRRMLNKCVSEWKEIIKAGCVLKCRCKQGLDKATALLSSACWCDFSMTLRGLQELLCGSKELLLTLPLVQPLPLPGQRHL